jgi:SAM-dependent methyltransferase
MNDTNTDYLLGTGEGEVWRLGLQHAVWRPRALAAWRRAGFNVGQRLLDLGCGPGYATLDLADVVGPRGKILAADRSPGFLEVLNEKIAQRALGNIETRQLDLDEDALPYRDLDGAWVRWVFAFVLKPRELVRRVAATLRPGGTLVIHEYIAYESWRFAPPVPEQAAFVDAVVRSWRDQGGEPDIGLQLPRWLTEESFEVVGMRTHMDVIRPDDFMWQWPIAFVQSHTDRLVELGYFTPEMAARTREAVNAASRIPGTYMLTPAVVEIIARRT